MRTYIYPENLRATVKLWFWNIRDFCIICAGIILSALLFAKLYTVVPLSLTACFAFLSLRADDTAIMIGLEELLEMNYPTVLKSIVHIFLTLFLCRRA